jgi:hypothetical protein
MIFSEVLPVASSLDRVCQLFIGCRTPIPTQSSLEFIKAVRRHVSDAPSGSCDLDICPARRDGAITK